MSKKYNGFTLVEVMISVAIFAILIIPIGIIIKQSIQANVKAQINIEVAQVLNNAVEKVIYENITGSGSIDYYGGKYKLEYNIDPNYRQTDIRGIQNSEVDFTININNNTAEILSGSSSYNINLSTTQINKIKVKIVYNSSNKIATYYIYKDDNNIADISFTVSNSKLGGYLISNTSTTKLVLLLDGVYDFSDNLTDTMFQFWYNSGIGQNIKIAALSPFISFDKRDIQTINNESEFIKKIDLSIKDNKNNMLKQATFYYSNRVK
ncbi:prepilin-type N-terminal cleavage/methylation domain-containing protein [Caldicellulosiruptoraceae bacterium PP1]